LMKMKTIPKMATIPMTKRIPEIVIIPMRKMKMIFHDNHELRKIKIKLTYLERCKNVKKERVTLAKLPSNILSWDSRCLIDPIHLMLIVYFEIKKHKQNCCDLH